MVRHPHRGSATAAEATAATDLSLWLQELGYQMEEQPFRAPRDTLYLGPALAMLGFLVAAKVSLWLPWLGLILTALLLLPMIGELICARLDFDPVLPLYPSRNLVARRPEVEAGRPTLVITAHYDTQRASFLFHPRFAPWIQLYFNLVYGGLLLIPVAISLRWASGGSVWTGWLLGVGVALTALNSAFLLICRLTGGYINGANDNGSGVALLLAMAERWTQEPVPGVEPLFLLTGSEEVGTRGMKRFLRDCRLDPARTLFINLDNLGAGTLHYLAGEGMLLYRPYSAELCDLAEELGAQHPGRVQRKENLLLPTDGLPPLKAGFRCITFIAFDKYGRLPHYHWYSDTLEQIESEQLAFTEAFLWSYAVQAASLVTRPDQAVTDGRVSTS